MNVKRLRAAYIAAILLCGSAPVLADAPQMNMEHAQQTRYYGQPDLALTSALVTAGGGANFKAATLFGVLAGKAQTQELQALQQRYGPQRVNDFLATFTYAINDAVRTATAAKVAIPPADPALSGDGRGLSLALVKAGTMPNGRFDVGYMIEHLVSRPVHIAIMRDMNADPSIGPQRNADFHVILTGVINDLQRLYAS